MSLRSSNTDCRPNLRLLVTMALTACAPAVSCAVYADTPAPAAATPAATADAPQPALIPYTLPELYKRVPPLKHDASGRLPIISIQAFRTGPDDNSYAAGKPLPESDIKELVKRGLTQWIPPREMYIPYAQALQAAGAGVVMMEGQAFNGPEGDSPDGLHKLPANYPRDPDQPAQQPRYPCPLLTDGWKAKSDELRTTFKKYKDAGVNISAVWLDWEVEPYPGQSQWREAKACSRCQTMFPRGVLNDFDRYRAFITLWRDSLFSTYFVAPILEQYPSCSVTNWTVVTSSRDHPTPTWGGNRLTPPENAGMFTATNPVAYGNTIWYDLHWKEHKDWPLDVPHMDRVYTAVMLGQMSGDTENRMKMTPEKQSVPWVDRFCNDDPNPKILILSRERYREILRHIWLRGADSMQIFNPEWGEKDVVHHNIEMEEVEDVVSVYDEMLANRPFLDGGVVMNTNAPDATYDGAIWSGKRLGDKALVRGFTQGAQAATATITPFDGAGSVTISCPPEGVTYLLTRNGDRVKVEKQ